MADVALVEQRLRQGLFYAAADAVRPLDASQATDPWWLALAAEAYERTGRAAEATAAVADVCRRGPTATRALARALIVRGVLELERGNADESIVTLERSQAVANQVGSPAEVCWSQLRLLLSQIRRRACPRSRRRRLPHARDGRALRRSQRGHRAPRLRVGGLRQARRARAGTAPPDRRAGSASPHRESLAGRPGRHRRLLPLVPGDGLCGRRERRQTGAAAVAHLGSPAQRVCRHHRPGARVDSVRTARRCGADAAAGIEHVRPEPSMPRLRARRAGTARTASRQSGQQPAPGGRSAGVDQPAPRVSPRVGRADQGRDAVAAGPLPGVPGAVRSGAGGVARADRQGARAAIAAHLVRSAGAERLVHRGRTRGRAGTSGRGQLIVGLAGGAEPSHRQRVVPRRPRVAGRSARGSRAAPGGADTEAARRWRPRRVSTGRDAGAEPGGRGGDARTRVLDRTAAIFEQAGRPELAAAEVGRLLDDLDCCARWAVVHETGAQPLCRRGQRPDVAGRPARPAQRPGRVLHRLVRSRRPPLLDRRRTTALDCRHRELRGGAATGAPLRVGTGRTCRRCRRRPERGRLRRDDGHGRGPAHRAARRRLGRARAAARRNRRRQGMARAAHSRVVQTRALAVCRLQLRGGEPRDGRSAVVRPSQGRVHRRHRRLGRRHPRRRRRHGACSTRSATCRPIARPSCCDSWKPARCTASARCCPARPTCASWPRPIVASRTSLRPA